MVYNTISSFLGNCCLEYLLSEACLLVKYFGSFICNINLLKHTWEHGEDRLRLLSSHHNHHLETYIQFWIKWFNIMSKYSDYSWWYMKLNWSDTFILFDKKFIKAGNMIIEIYIICLRNISTILFLWGDIVMTWNWESSSLFWGGKHWYSVKVTDCVLLFSPQIPQSL